MLLLPPFGRWGNRGTGEIKSFPVVSELGNDRTAVQRSPPPSLPLLSPSVYVKSTCHVSVMVPISQIGKLRLMEVKELVQGHSLVSDGVRIQTQGFRNMPLALAQAVSSHY